MKTTREVDERRTNGEEWTMEKRTSGDVEKSEHQYLPVEFV